MDIYSLLPIDIIYPLYKDIFVYLFTHNGLVRFMGIK